MHETTTSVKDDAMDLDGFEPSTSRSITRNDQALYQFELKDPQRQQQKITLAKADVPGQLQVTDASLSSVDGDTTKQITCAIIAQVNKYNVRA